MIFVTPILIVLAPGMVIFGVVVAAVGSKAKYQWWEYVAPWIAPFIWLSLSCAAPLHPPKSLGNLVEILGLSMLPAAYLLARAIGLKNRPGVVNGATVSVVAAISAVLVYFVFPSIPE
jgi:hypothetical protein